MLQFRDNTTKYIMLLGALCFLFISSSTQACVLAGHECAEPSRVDPAAQVSLQCHASMPQQADSSSSSELLQASSHQTHTECCQLLPADLGDFAKVQASNISSQQLSSDWFQSQLAGAFCASFNRLSLVQCEINAPPPQITSAVSSSLFFTLHHGRAPPSDFLI